ncbi:DUF4230 domain-containing protein [Rhizohabitans arisaemae]|uniref:DUF4230 domain-containing protein n=1 Tax=Rhizohabitans arisaemae TaxID=2720610 RepID=UPI0024B148AA|nr:DUF4230 domain-containing protein [Rhizohabitans arisaemae]
MKTAPSPSGAARRMRRRLVIAVVSLVVAIAVILGLGLAVAWWSPFGESTVDRSQPVLLESIRNLSRYEAATGSFQVVVDLEKDAAWLPDAIKGNRTLFVGAGGVDAYVDFSGIAGDGLKVSADRRTAELRLPRAQLEKPSLDNERSYVVAQQRGLIDRFQDLLAGSPADQRELYLLAEKKINDAALASDLRRRAEENTKSMLGNLLRSLGFTSVTVVFADNV